MATPALELVVLDVETSGMRPEEGHCVIELGAQRLRNSEVLASFDFLIKPSRPLDPEAQAVHGITELELLQEGRPAADVFAEFRAFAKDAVLVGHNIGFDLAFINTEYRRLGQEPLSNEILDTVALAKRYLILPSYSLKNVAAYLKVPQPKAHRALADVETTAQVLLKLIERAKKR